MRERERVSGRGGKAPRRWGRRIQGEREVMDIPDRGGHRFQERTSLFQGKTKIPSGFQGKVKEIPGRYKEKGGKDSKEMEGEFSREG